MTLKDELMELAERLEAYDPGRSLDNRADELELHQAVVMATGEGSLNAPFDRTFARSLDAAMKLVPEGWRVSGMGETVIEGDDPWNARLLEKIFDGRAKSAQGDAATAALALCAAALRARAAIAAIEATRPTAVTGQLEGELVEALRECLKDRQRHARKLSQARSLLREMQCAHRADIESYEDDGTNDYAPRVWRKVDRFLAKRALAKAQPGGSNAHSE